MNGSKKIYIEYITSCFITLYTPWAVNFSNKRALYGFLLFVCLRTSQIWTFCQCLGGWPDDLMLSITNSLLSSSSFSPLPPPPPPFFLLLFFLFVFLLFFLMQVKKYKLFCSFFLYTLSYHWLNQEACYVTSSLAFYTLMTALHTF